MRRIALALPALLALVLVPATAVAACGPQLQGTLLNVTCDDGDDQVVLERDAEGNLLVNGQPSGGGVLDVDRIQVDLGEGTNIVTIDETAGLLAPGKANEASGEPEIEVAVAGGDGVDEVAVVGQLVGDTIVVRNIGFDLNGDGDSDLVVTRVERFTIDAGAAPDRVDASAVGRSDGADAPSLRVMGGLGPDTLIGGARRDLLAGGPDDDRVVGGPGRDEVAGDDGNDVVAGGAGADLVEGGDGRDVLRGGVGDDEMNGGPRRDIGSGGRGEDRCRAIEKVTGCES